ATAAFLICRGRRMQGGQTGVGYGLKYQARCIADVKADTDQTTFIAGTLSLKEENEVHLIRLSSSETELYCEASCPFDARIFSTVFSTSESYGATVWKIPELYGQSSSPQLESLASLDDHTCKIKCVLWWPSGQHDKLISIDEENLFLWSLDSSNKTAKLILKVQSRESVGSLHYFSGGAWDPHDRNAVSATCDTSIQFWDLRTMTKTNSIEHAHVRSLDYNKKRQNILVTAEEEAGIRVWDLRMTNSPVRDFPGHAHWTWAVQFNPEYEELILSAGTDSAVNLWFASSLSSDDTSSESLVESPTRLVDPLLNSYNDYEDSVYGLAWSSRQPWIFASLSYDGRVVVESVKPYLSRK
ncbi:Earp and garp complex-interacting protein, partial [Thalictrum thalictroides]